MKLTRPTIALIVVTTAMCIMMSTLSVLRYRSYNAKMQDLGHMAQAIWSVTQGRPLEYTREDGRFPTFSRLGWHAEIIYYPISLIYRLFPFPVTLLLIQSIWYAMGALPLYALAHRRLESEWASLVVSVIYLFYPVAQTAVLFDVHGDTLAMPALLFCLLAAERRRWAVYAVWVAVALSCKVYVFVPVGVMGLVIAVLKHRRAGALTVLGALLWGAYLLLMVRPLYTPTSSAAVTGGLADYLRFYFDLRSDVLSTLWHRVVVAVIVLAPTSLFAPHGYLWMLPALSVVVPVLLSDGPGPSYHYSYHHYALAVPFLMMVIIEGTRVLKRSGRRMPWWLRSRHQGLLVWPVVLAVALGLTLALSATFVDVPYNRRFWQSEESVRPNEMTYKITDRDRTKDRWLATYVPPEVSLAASVTLAPHVANRQILFTSYNLEGNLSLVDYAAFDALFDHVAFLGGDSFAGGVLQDVPALRQFLDDPHFGVVSSHDGLVFVARGEHVGAPLLQSVEVAKGDSAGNSIPEVAFDDAIGLVESELRWVGAQRIRLRFDWVPLRSLAGRPALVAVSEFEDTEGSRYVHLPTHVLFPTSAWAEGDLVRESFEIELPAEMPSGVYQLVTAWYDAGHPYAYATDERSRVGGRVPVAQIRLP